MMENKPKEVQVLELAQKVLNIEKETRLQNNGTSNKSVAVTKILRMLDDEVVLEDDNQ